MMSMPYPLEKPSTPFFLNEKGGIVDDLLLYRMAAKEYLAVVNAANIAKDWNHIMASKAKKAKWENLSDNWSILALQGPRSQEVMHRILEKSTSSLSNQNDCPVTFSNGASGYVARTGYTGETGYEIMIPQGEATISLWEVLEKEHSLRLIGLGARDTLRTEMGFCLSMVKTSMKIKVQRKQG